MMGGGEEVLNRAQAERQAAAQPSDNLVKSAPYEDALYSVKLAFMDTQNMHLNAEKRFDRWGDFIYVSLSLLEMLFPDDATLMGEIRQVREGVKAIPEPRLTFESQTFNDARVMELSSEAGHGSRDRPSAELAPEFYQHAKDREYKVALREIREYGTQVHAEMVKRDLLDLRLPDEENIVPALPRLPEKRSPTMMTSSEARRLRGAAP
jgi:hypothetical protein